MVYNLDTYSSEGRVPRVNNYDGSTWISVE